MPLAPPHLLCLEEILAEQGFLEGGLIAGADDVATPVRRRRLG